MTRTSLVLTRHLVPWLFASLVALTLAGCDGGVKEGRARIEARFRPEEVLLSAPTANFFGRESLRSGQIRGSGALVLAADRLWFSQLLPASELSIPLSDVVAVDTVDGFLGKTISRPLLRVRFRDGAREDAVAWFVPDLERWTREIKARLPR